MTVTIHDVPKTNHDFKAIVAVAKAAQSNPFNGMWPMFEGPIFQGCVARVAAWHAADPTSYWVYATDDETGDVVGALGWNVYEKNPYEKGVPEIVPEWWPEGDMREIAQQVFTGFYASRPKYASKPHLLISYCVVHPSSRRRGIASLMMQRALKRADELDLETLVESTQNAEPFYHSHGFVTARDFTLDAKVDAPSEEFERLKRELFPLHGWIMWRPKKDNA